MATVLVVEDDEAIRGAIRLALEEGGHPVAEGSGAGEGLARLQTSSHPLVALLDHRLGDTQGDDLALLRAIQADARLASRHRYVLMTATPLSRLALPDDVRHLLAAPVVSKPFELDDFLATVDAAAARLPSS
jgi:CheY-like chemotaxis protein